MDWNNDGTADTVDPTATATADTVTASREHSSIGMSLIASSRSCLFRPSPRDEPYDQSGARVWSRTASNVRQRPWHPRLQPGAGLGRGSPNGQPAAPGLDVGTSIPPLRLIEGTKSLTVATDTAPIGVLNPGDTVTYNITVKNSGSVVVNNVYVYDTVPANTSYVANTTQKDLTSNAGTGPWVSSPTTAAAQRSRLM